MNKEELIEVFKDTEKLYTTDEGIKFNTEHCINDTVIYDPSLLELCYYPYDKPAKVKVTNKDTFSAAQPYAKIAEIDDGETVVAILNFASATNPGGGVTKGSSAQEECLCRCSNLYPALNQTKCFGQYYNINRLNNDNRGSDKIIYTRDVLVFKDKDYNLLEPNNRFYVDVITCAAPNLRDYPCNYYIQNAPKKTLQLTNEELYSIHVKRAHAILDVALLNGVTHIILGAFGCGAFKNDPETVAKAYKDVIEEYKYRFEVIEFAIIGKNDNYDIFKRVLLG